MTCCEKMDALCKASYNPRFDAQLVHIYPDGTVKPAGYYYEGGGDEWEDDTLKFKLCPYCGKVLE